MGGGQSQEAPTATATRNSSDQQIGGRDVSSRKSEGVPSLQQIDLSRGRRMVVDDGRRGEGGERQGRESDESPSLHVRHHTLSQPSSHSHNPPNLHPHNSHGGHSQRPHPHRQHHHIHRPLPELPTENLHPLDMDLNTGVPIFSSSRTQLAEPSDESQHPPLSLVLPSRQRRYFNASNPADLDLDLSMASLSRRLRAVGLIAEGNGSSVGGISSGNGGAASSSSRRHHRPRRHHSHSSHSGRSRHHLSSSDHPSSVVLVRGLAGSKLMCGFSLPLSALSLSLLPSFSVSIALSLSISIGALSLLPSFFPI